MSRVPGDPDGALRCVVAYASPRVQFHVELTLAAGATAAAARDAARQALEAGRGRLEAGSGEGGPIEARRQALAEIPWQGGECAVFGLPVDWSRALRDGDRVEIIRPLQADPRDRRRTRVAESRRGRR